MKRILIIALSTVVLGAILIIGFRVFKPSVYAPKRVMLAAPVYSSGSLDWVPELVKGFSPAGAEPYGVLASVPEKEYPAYLQDRVGDYATEDLYYAVNGYHLKIFWNEEKLQSLPDGVQPGLSGLGQYPSAGDGMSYFPLTWYYWGLYTNPDVLAEAGVHEVPQDWSGFLELCSTLKQSGITPIYIPKKELWAGALWFEYLNLRLNGAEFHQSLLDGSISFTDPRFLNTLKELRSLHPYMAEADIHKLWEEGIFSVNNGDAAFVLMGRFAEALWKGPMEWIPFPELDSSIEPSELISSAGFVYSSKAFDIEESQQFLQYLSSPDAVDIVAKGGDNLPVATAQWWMEQPQGIEKTAWMQASQADILLPVMERNTHPQLLLPIKLTLREVIFGSEDLNILSAKLEEKRSSIEK